MWTTKSWSVLISSVPSRRQLQVIRYLPNYYCMYPPHYVTGGWDTDTTAAPQKGREPPAVLEPPGETKRYHHCKFRRDRYLRV